MRRFPACNANYQNPPRILILAEASLQEPISVSIEGQGQSPFDVKWLWDGPNRAKNEKTRNVSPPPSEARRLKQYSIVVEIYQLPYLREFLWEMVGFLNAQADTGFSISTEASRVNAVTALAWGEVKAKSSWNCPSRARSSSSVFPPATPFTAPCSQCSQPHPAGWGRRGMQGMQVLHHHLQTGSAQPSSELGSCLSYQEPGQTPQSWTRLSRRGWAPIPAAVWAARPERATQKNTHPHTLCSMIIFWRRHTECRGGKCCLCSRMQMSIFFRSWERAPTNQNCALTEISQAAFQM